MTLVLDVDDRGRSRPEGARREEQAIDRKTSDRLAVRPRQVDRQAGPDVGEEVWRRRRPWRSPRKRRRVSETLSGRDRCPPPPSIPPAPSEGGPDRHHARLRSLAPPWLTPACCSWFSKKLTFFFFSYFVVSPPQQDEALGTQAMRRGDQGLRAMLQGGRNPRGDQMPGTQQTHERVRQRLVSV